MSQSNLPSKILMVDDDPTVPQALEEPMGRYGVRVDKASNLETALYHFNQQRYDVVFIEIEFAPLPGLALVQKWRQHDVVEKGTCAFIMMSGNKNLGMNEGLIKELGDLEVITKPFGIVQALPYLSRGIATRKRAAAFQDMKSRVLDYYAKTGDFNKAAEQVQKKLGDLGPKGLEMLYDLYEKANRFEDALAIVNPLLEREPNNIVFLNAKSRLLMRLGKFAEAKACLEKCDEIAPQNIARLNEMATTYLHLKDPANSVKRFKQILDLTPENPEVKFEMFSKLYDMGYDEHAVEFGKESAKPMEIVRHYNNKGVMLSKESDTAGALMEYGRALKFFPTFKENYRIYFNIALANLQTKTPEAFAEAARNLKKCLELCPDFEKAQKTLETIEKHLDKTTKAAS